MDVNDKDVMERKGATRNGTPPTHIIRAVYTKTTIRVYQAYNDGIADAAVEAQSFRTAMEKGLWSPKRMTWIKPSKVWMAYRCGWTELKDNNQGRVLALDIDRSKFEDLLSKAILSHGSKCRNQSVVVQWDPEREINPRAPEHQVFTKPTQDIRSIQIGLRPPANQCLLDPQTVVRITDVTQDFRSALRAMQQGCDLNDVEALLWPNGQSETVMSVPSHIEATLGMTPREDTETMATTNNKQQAVIVLGCAANPPHQGHLHCIKAAQAHAEQALGYEVLFSTIAIAPFAYVKSKWTKNNCTSLVLENETRLTLLRVTAADRMKKDKSFRFHTPTRPYGSALECGRALRPHSNVLVIVVVGGDRFKWTKPSHSDVVTLCCARSQEQYAQLQASLQKDIDEGLVSDPTRWQLLSTVGPPTSSTRIRSILVDNGTTVQQKQNSLTENGYPEEAVQLLLRASSKWIESAF